MRVPSANEWMEAGIWLQLCGDCDGARRLFERAVDLEPSNQRVRKLLELVPPVRTRPELALEINPQFWPFLPVAVPRYVNPFVRPDPSPPAERGPSAELRTGSGSEWGAETEKPVVTLGDKDLVDPAVEDEPMGEMDLREEAPPPQQIEEASEPEREFDLLIAAAKELAQLDNHLEALELIQRAQALAPEDTTVRLLREHSEGMLAQRQESEIGSLDAVPRLAMAPEEIDMLDLDQKSGFVLAEIDGSLTFEDLFALSGMPRFETARILADLLARRVITK